MGVHVYPVNDLKDHELEGTECECEPRIDWIDPDTELPYPSGPLVVHNSFDGREQNERPEN